MKLNSPTGQHVPIVYLKKMINIMRLSILFCLLSIFCASATTMYSQVAEISLNLQNVTMLDAFNAIKQQSGYSFWYRNEEVDLDKKISVNVNKQEVGKVLEKLLFDQNLSYTIDDTHIVIYRKEQKASSTGQNVRKVSGVIQEAQGTPIIGANVVIKGTTNGTITDLDGKFSLDVKDDHAVLVVSYIGYSPQEIVVGNQKSVIVKMQEDSQTIEDVVVIGYGVTKKRDLAGAVGAIKMDETVISSPAVDAGQAIVGRVAGVQVLSSSGRPGSSSTVQIRGVNSITAGQAPLVVIDGIQMPDYDLNLIPPSNIESIDILKDAASAAIYGSRGTNGVILITTKNGKEGKGKLNFGYKFTLQKSINKIDVMNSAQYAEAAKDAIQNAWIDDGGDPNAPNTLEARGNYKYTWPTALDNPTTLYDTDWQDEVLRTAPMHQVDLNYSWGNKISNFSVFLGTVNQTGILVKSDYQKYTMSMQASTKVKDWLQLGGMMTTVYDSENEPFNRTLEWSVQYPSIYPVYGENGYLGEPNTTKGFENYNSLLFRAKNGHPLYNVDYKQKNTKLKNYGNAFAAFDIIDGLTFKTTFNFYLNRWERDEYQTKDHNMGPNFQDPGIGKKQYNKMLYITSENLLTYNKDFGDHNISGLLGYEANYRNYENVVAARTDYENDLIPYILGGSTLAEASDSEVETARVSWFARAAYSFAGKYMASASIRRDGSSRFGTNNKWGYFPSVSGAWRISDESFFLPLTKIANTMKIRASYGITGNDGIGDYSWIASLDKGKIVYNNQIQSTFYPGKISNNDLRWERLQQLNLGLDMGFLQNRIMVELDWYRSYCDGLLLNVPIPATSGFTSELKNIGELENKGIEFNLTTRNLVGKFQWQTVFNISSNKNKVLSLGQDDAPMIFNPFPNMALITEVGQELYQFYGYNYQGVIMNDQELASAAKYANIGVGYGKFEDVNKDGKIDSEDRTSLGSNVPKFVWGMTNTFKYKGFDLSFLLQGAHGHKVFDYNIHRTMYYHEGRNYLAEVVDRYRSPEQPGDGWHYKLNRNLLRKEVDGSSYMLRNADYVRLKNLSLGYTLPSKVLESLKIGNIRFFVNVTNLFTITSFPGMDPESFKGESTEARRRGASDNEYPTAKTFTMGFNLEL